LRKTFIRGGALAAAEAGNMTRFLKTMLLVALGLAVVASTFAVPLAGAAPQIGPAPGAAKTITLYASFNPPTGWGLTPTSITEPGPMLTVDQGDVITFQLYSNDTMTHQLIVDLDNSHTNSTGDGYSPLFASKTTATVWTYTANTAGTFAYFCGYHGYASQHGTIVVTAAPPPPPADNTLLIVGGVVVLVVIVGVAAAAMRMRRKKPGPPGQTGP
jgi:heme/copper-type cytochrome/quinol oxidase subunit 2